MTTQVNQPVEITEIGYDDKHRPARPSCNDIGLLGMMRDWMAISKFAVCLKSLACIYYVCKLRRWAKLLCFMLPTASMTFANCAALIAVCFVLSTGIYVVFKLRRSDRRMFYVADRHTCRIQIPPLLQIALWIFFCISRPVRFCYHLWKLLIILVNYVEQPQVFFSLFFFFFLLPDTVNFDAYSAAASTAKLHLNTLDVHTL